MPASRANCEERARPSGLPPRGLTREDGKLSEALPTDTIEQRGATLWHTSPYTPIVYIYPFF